jgi:penicillin-binding protein 1C
VGVIAGWRCFSALPALLAAVAVALAAGALPVAAAWLVPLPARLAVAPSTVVLFADGSPAHVFLAPDDRYRMAVSLDEVDPAYLAALLRFEDKRFWRHGGVDPLAVARSAALNVRHGRVLSGASTLTMQLVRLAEPRPRSLPAKTVEALRAVQLELRFSKREILERYLALTPYGGNLEGIEAASWAYFGHGARELSADEIAVLLAVPQRPARRHPTPANQEALRKGRDGVARWLVAHGGLESALPERLLTEVAAAPVPREPRPMPRHAPHAAYWLKGRHPETTRIATTLDRDEQRLAERLLHGARGEMAALGIRHGAVVLANHRSGELRALVGGLDYWRAAPGDQIAAFDAPRSPGSALKPFLFAAAIDAGLALPGHLVADVPASWGGYAPANYDGRFAGLIALEDALAHSLNLPFVRLLGELGVERFLGSLRGAGLRHLASDPGHYGLSAAIGALEVSPLEMAGLYAALAAEGHYRPLRLLAAESAAPSRPLVSPGAAYLTRSALSRRDRPDFPERRRFTGAPAAVHWKTGTSYGHRDAWAVGSGARATAVVWLGNLDNAPAVDLVGAEAAGPLLFDLLQAVDSGPALPAPEQAPPDLKAVEVCAYSGHLPTAACPSRRDALAPRRRVPPQRCPFHRQVDVDLATGLALHPGCHQGRRWETRTFLAWPAPVRRFVLERHRLLPEVPALAPGCVGTGEGERLAILSPPPGQVLLLLPGVPPSSQEVPLEAEGSPGGLLSWFVGGRFLGRAAPDERLWWTPSPGRHEVVVMDEAGALARRVVEVRRAG